MLDVHVSHSVSYLKQTEGLNTVTNFEIIDVNLRCEGGRSIALSCDVGRGATFGNK